MATTPEATKPKSAHPKRAAIEISAATRQAVQAAAKKQGIAPGAWIEKTLGKAAKNVMMGGPPILALPSELLDTLSDMSKKISDLAERQMTDVKVVSQLENTVTDLRPRVAAALDQMKKFTGDMVDQVISTSESAFSHAGEATATTLETLGKRVRTAAHKSKGKRKRAKRGTGPAGAVRTRKGASRKRKSPGRKRG